MPYNLPLLLLPLLGGFVFTRNWYRTRWHTKRADKDRLIVHASLAGLASLAIAYIFARVASDASSDASRMSIWWDWLHLPWPHTGKAVLSFLIAALGWAPLNWFEDIWYDGKAVDAENARIIRDYGSPLETTLFRSMEKRKLVMLTLTNNKVYIGGVAQTFIPDEKVIYLFPTHSGYRDSDQRLELTTQYTDVYKQIAHEEPSRYREILTDFRIAIPVEFVVSASLYLPDIHAKYFARKLIINETHVDRRIQLT